MISGSVFSTLNEAWDKFKKDNGLWATTWLDKSELTAFPDHRLLLFRFLSQSVFAQLCTVHKLCLGCSFRNSDPVDVVAFVLSITTSTLTTVLSNCWNFARWIWTSIIRRLEDEDCLKCSSETAWSISHGTTVESMADIHRQQYLPTNSQDPLQS